MKNNMFRKGLVVGIIILFLVAGVVPSISGGSGIKSVIIVADNITNTISRTTIYDGSLSGYVNDISMYPIEGALVRVYFHGTYEEDYSDSTGYYHVTDIPICYCLKNCTALKEGYSTEWVLLGITENTTYDFILTPIDPPCYPVIDGTMGENGWYVSCVSIDFVINPELVAGVYYSIDGGEETLYTEPFEVCEDGFHELLWRAVDHEGSWSDPAVIYFRIDQTPPVTDLDWEVWREGWNTWYVKFIFTATDELSGMAPWLLFYINDVLLGEFEVLTWPTVEFVIQWSKSFKSCSFKFECFDMAGNPAFELVNGSDIKSYPSSQSSSSQQSSNPIIFKILDRYRFMNQLPVTR